MSNDKPVSERRSSRVIVRVRDSTLRQIKAIAKGRGLRVSDVVRGWIAEKVGA